MKLEVGKTYSDRHGAKVKIIRYDPDNPLPYLGDDGCGYLADGRFNYFENGTEWKLITEIK